METASRLRPLHLRLNEDAARVRAKKIVYRRLTEAARFSARDQRAGWGRLTAPRARIVLDPAFYLGSLATRFRRHG